MKSMKFFEGRERVLGSNFDPGRNHLKQELERNEGRSDPAFTTTSNAHAHSYQRDTSRIFEQPARTTTICLGICLQVEHPT